jgi:hypothetical protein
MKRYIVMFLFVLSLTACGKYPAYYRQEVDGEYTYWYEYHRTTFHGICANMYHTAFWVVEHPHGHKQNADGTIGSVDTDTKTFTTKSDAEAYAESVCPTK